MTQIFTMPKFGQTMEEGTVIRWLKKEGDFVKRGEILLEVETDKAAMDVESDLEGTLLKILAQEGKVVPCGESLAWIGKADESVS